MKESPSKRSDVATRRSRPTSDAHPLNVTFTVLADQRRRYVLHCLRKCQTPMAVADLAHEVASMELGTPLPDVPAEEVKRVYLSLQHTHIPKLVDAEVAEYTRGRDLVGLSTKSERLEPLLEFTAAHQ